MFYRLLADSIVLVHFVFAVFAVFGGILIFRWRKVVWIHIPCALWAALVETAGWFCPLTPLENTLRIRSGAVGYDGGFVEHYILPLLYPVDLTRKHQIVLGILVILVNLSLYGALIATGSLKKKASET